MRLIGFAKAQQNLNHIIEEIADGSLAVPVEATYPIEEIKAAVEHAGRGHRDGNILLTPNGAVG
ncbi:MAG: zinc-binding dehydrogenase [Alphaproteobacteria bacterium]|nr:zinc-binding dehydrogenase [Alphaproteobacteria bacterium]MDP6567538.1 zinc-binding dehydrogenase [Alphaproteobacteria bacterium]